MIAGYRAAYSRCIRGGNFYVKDFSHFAIFGSKLIIYADRVDKRTEYAKLADTGLLEEV